MIHWDLLLQQTLKPDEVILWLSEEQFPNKQLPENLTRLQEFGLSIKWCKDDIKSFKKLIKFTTLLVFPAMTGITLLSKPIILVLLGEKWLQASDLLFWLALSYMFVPLSSLNLNNFLP